MSNPYPEYFGGTPTKGYDPEIPGIVGSGGGQGAKQTKSFFQEFVQSDEFQGFTAPWRAIGGFIAEAGKQVDRSMSFGAGVQALEATAESEIAGLDDVTQDKYVKDVYEQALKNQAASNPYGLGPGPLAAGLGAAEGAWSYIIARPASTSIMILDPNNPYTKQGLIRGVRDSFNRSEVVSFGQAAIANPIVNKTNPIGMVGDALGLDKYNIYEDTDMSFAQMNPYYQALTGATDATLEVGIPVPVLKPLRLAALKKVGIRPKGVQSQAELDIMRTEYAQHKKAVGDELRVYPEEDISGQLDGTMSEFDSGMEFKTKKTGIGYQVYRIAETTDSDAIARNPLVQGTPGIDQVRLTEVLARTDDPDTVFNIIMGTRGDLQAIRELADAAPDTVWSLANANEAIFAASLDDVPFRPTGEAAIKTRQIFDSSAAADAYFAEVRNLLTRPDGTPYVAGTSMPGGYLVERTRTAAGDFVYKWNTGEFANSPGWVRAVAESRIVGGPTTHFIHWVAGKQPLGRVSRSSARPNDVMLEFDAMVNNVPMFRGKREVTYAIDADGNPLTMPANQWVREQRQRLREGIAGRNLEGTWRQIEEDAVYTMSMTMNFSHDVAMTNITNARALRGSADEVINYLEKNDGYLFSEYGDRIVYSPETRSMLLDSFDTMDLLAVYDELNLRAPSGWRRKGVANIDRVESISGNVFDSLQKFFRSNVLLRLGYIPKNSVGEPWLASLIAHGTILTDEGLVPATKNFLKNRQNQARRARYRADLLDRVRAVVGKGPGTRAGMRGELEQLVREYTNARAAYEIAYADLEAVKKGLVPPSKVPVVSQRSKSTLFEAQKLMDSIERTLDDSVPEWRQVVPPASISDVAERVRELKAITGDDTSLIDDLYRERQEILLRADSAATDPLRSIDAEISALTREIHELQDVMTVHEAKLDHISVAAVKGEDAVAPRPTLTTVRYKDGSEVTYYGDRRTVFERHYVPEADYRGWHQAPGRDYGGPLTDPNEFFPNITDPKIYYGEYTAELREIVEKVNGNPDAYITVYRALPEGKDINPGDWVSPFKSYAELHAGDLLQDGWTIKSKKVRAGDVYTEGNSVAEWGWDPKYQDDVLSVEVLPGVDSSEVMMAVGRDLRGVSMQRQMDVATTKLDHLSKRRAEILRTGVAALRESKMSVSDKARLASIEAQLERILRFQTDEYAISRVTVEPDGAVFTMNESPWTWSRETDPYFFPEPRNFDANAGSQLDSYLGRDEFSVQDSLRAIWNDPEGSVGWDLATQMENARVLAQQGVRATDVREVQDVVRRIEDNGIDLGMQADPYSMIRSMAEATARNPEEAARQAAVVNQIEELGLDSGAMYRILEQRAAQLEGYEGLSASLGDSFGPQDMSQAVRERHYDIAQQSLEAQGYGPGDLISVWRTGSDETNSGVVAVTTQEGGLDNFSGKTIEYKVRRDRVLFDAVASREARDGEALAPGMWTAQEKELGIHMNDLIPVREYAPVLRQSDTTTVPEGLRDVTLKGATGEQFAVVLNSTDFRRNNVVRAKMGTRDLPTGSVKIDDLNIQSPTVMLLDGKNADQLVQDLRVYASAKFFDSPAEVMEYVRVVDPQATDILIEDAMRRTRNTAQAAFDGSIPTHEWIDEFFDEYWSLRHKQTGAQRPDIGVGLADPNSPWWDIDPGEIGAVKADGAYGDVSNVNTKVYETTLDGMGDNYERVWFAFGDIAPSRGVKGKAEDPVMAPVREMTADLEGMLDQAIREVDGSIDGSAAAMRAADKKMKDVEQKIKDLEQKLGVKEAKLDSTYVYYGSGRGPMTMRVGSEKMTVPGPLADDQYALGEQWASEASASGTTRLTYDPSFSASTQTSRMTDAGSTEVIGRYDPRYWEELAYVINAHFRSDPLVGQILAGKTKKEVADWLRTPEGRAHAASLGKDYLTLRQQGSDPVRPITADRPVTVMLEEARDIDELFDIVYSYVPNADVRSWITQRVGTGKFDSAGREIGVSPGELRALLSGEEDLSRILAQRGEWATDKYGQKWASNALDRLWQFIATMPEDRLSRWPFFTREFKHQMEQRANILSSQGAKMTVDELQALRQTSRRAALAELEKTFYNIRRYNNGVYLSRFLMSFPGAFFNSLYRYGRFGVREPERLLTASLLAGDGLRVLATDENGNPITEENIGDSTWIVIPGTKQSPEDKGVRFPVGSLATMVVDYPSFSYLMNVATSWFIRQNPKNDERFRDAAETVGLGDMYDQMFPFGPPANPFSSFFGSWQKDLYRGVRGIDDTDFIRTSVAFYGDKMAQWEKDGMQGEPPTLQEAVDDTRAFFFSRSGLKNFNPLSVDKQPPGQLMREAWYEHRTLYPNDTAEARDAFMKKYGDWARWYTYSSSEYTTYLPSSTEMYERVWEQHPNLVEQLVAEAGTEEAMKYVSLIALDVDNTFNQAVNQFLRNNPLPGDDVPVVRRIQPSRFDNIVKVQDGWRLFSKYSVEYEAEIERLRDLRDNASTVEKQNHYRKQIYLTEQEWKRWQNEGPLGGNRAWQNDRAATDDRAVIAGNFLRAIVEDKKFAETTGKSEFWQNVKLFVETEQDAYRQYQKLRKNEDKAEYRARFREWLNNEFIPGMPEWRPVYERYFANRWDPNEESTQGGAE
jgi:hypothetical protein